jgi:N-acetylglutamate synthase-like GNAT family acetyltransferase
MMIRECTDADFDAILDIINDAARAYKGVIPADCWAEPYMPRQELKEEIEAGVIFWGSESDGTLVGVMGLQDRSDVSLIRHAYVRSSQRNCGIGTRLLHALEAMTDKPLLIGTWADATWALAFYQKNGYRLLSAAESSRLLHKYWSIPERQVETSVVLASSNWRGAEEAH